MKHVSYDTARLTVHLGALAANYREAIRRASATKVAPVVKADAYGLGAIEVSHALGAAGADTFFVARLAEGVALRAGMPRARILVLDGLEKGAAPAFATHNLIPVLNAFDEVAEWSRFARSRRARLDAALHVDTGMNRSGLSHAELAQVTAKARDLFAPIHLALIMSHLACAEDAAHPLNKKQLQRFRAALAMLPPAPASLAASAGIGLGRDYRFDLVRPGLALYGGNPHWNKPNPYKMVVSLTGRILQLRRIEKGETVGYGATFKARRHSILATAAAGYADGIMRASGRAGQVAVGGVVVPFAGRISMDLMTIDVTDVPAAKLKRGAEVQYLGDIVSIEDVAKTAGTIGHDVLTHMHPRAKRVYVER